MPSVKPWDQAILQALRHVTAYPANRALTRATVLADLGVDSIVLSEVIIVAEEIRGEEMSLDAFDDLETVGSIETVADLLRLFGH